MRTVPYLANGRENQGYEVCELCGAHKIAGAADAQGWEHKAATALRVSWQQFGRDPVDWILLNLRHFNPEMTLEQHPRHVLGVLCRLIKFVEKQGGTRQGAEFRLSHMEARFKRAKWMLRHKGKAKL